MNTAMIGRLQGAMSAILEVQALLPKLREEHEKAQDMALRLGIAFSYLTELSEHLRRGADVYDAVLSTVRGELPLGPTA